jgi:hypothetical protein
LALKVQHFEANEINLKILFLKDFMVENAAEYIELQRTKGVTIDVVFIVKSRVRKVVVLEHCMICRTAPELGR